MRYDGTVRVGVASATWQDYRAADCGMVVTYDTDPVSEMPIREVPEEIPSDVIPEPNYETMTYGMYGCSRHKLRSAFAKSKLRYLFFMARYQGSREEFRDKYYVTGLYRVVKTADVHKLHLRYLSEASCLDAESCTALLAEQAHFVSLDEALAVTEDTLKLWEYSARVTRQTRILVNEDHTRNLLEYLLSKPNIVEDYVRETKRLQPRDPDEEETEDDEEEDSVTGVTVETTQEEVATEEETVSSPEQQAPQVPFSPEQEAQAGASEESGERVAAPAEPQEQAAPSPEDDAEQVSVPPSEEKQEPPAQQDPVQ